MLKSRLYNNIINAEPDLYTAYKSLHCVQLIVS